MIRFAIQMEFMRIKKQMPFLAARIMGVFLIFVTEESVLKDIFLIA